MLTDYDIVYALSFVFGVYTLYRFMGVFFEKADEKRKELLSYFVYYLMAVALNIFIGIPVVLTVFNIFALLGLSFNYDSGMKKRLSATVSIYIILMISELLAGFIIGMKGLEFSAFEFNQYSSIAGVLLSRIIGFFFVLIYDNYNGVKNGESIPTSKWVCVFLIPVSSIYTVLVVFSTNGMSFYNRISIALVLLFVNFATFYLYDVVAENMTNKMKQAEVEEQNLYYKKQYELIKSAVDNMDNLKHDLVNHMETVIQLIDMDEKEKAINHVLGIVDSSFTSKAVYNDSGNVVLDSILDFKLGVAKKYGIRCNIKILIPVELKLDSFLMTAVLGNLMDNAIEANRNLDKKERYIDLSVRYDRGRVAIRITNPYSHEILRDENSKRILTTKVVPGHGRGIGSIRSAVEKNGGLMDIDHDNGIFDVNVTIFCNEFE
jgi:sensor histidine kinase YesM